jgi:hypothetical protein
LLPSLLLQAVEWRQAQANGAAMWRFGYLRDQAGSRNLVFDLSIAHDRFGSSSHVQQNGALSHPQDLDGPMRVAAQRKINAYGQQYADNQNISFLPAIMSTSTLKRLRGLARELGLARGVSKE